MGKGWSYAALSHDAKEHGGPESYVTELKRAGRTQGFCEGIVCSAGFVVFVGLLRYYRDKRKQKERREQELIRKICSEGNSVTGYVVAENVQESTESGD